MPVRGPGFDGQVWVEGTRRDTLHSLEALRAGRSLPPAGDHALLVALAAAVAAGRDRVGILEFGGGMGIAYVHARAALPRSIAVEHTVVETPAVCRAGAALYGPGDTISFVTALPEHASGVDIVYCRSALQYVEDYASVLRRLLRYRARFVLFTELSAGAIPTYATAQLNVPGSVIAYWFHSLDEIVGVARQEGYAPLMTLTSSRVLPAAAVPPGHRLERPCHLLFGHDARP